MSHILIFEPRVQGHHLDWLRYVTEDLLAAGFKPTLAVDGRPGAKDLIKHQLSHVIEKINLLSIFNQVGKLRGGSKLKALSQCLDECGATEVFVNSLDEFASGCLRSASLGIFPPDNLLTRLSGVYFRPRFLANSFRPFGNIIKSIGFKRLHSGGWFNKIYLLDEYMFATLKGKKFESIFHLLPDPWEGDFSISREKALQKLKIPEEKVVCLNYGIGSRRKGLQLVIRAMLRGNPNSRLFLLCGGRIADDREINNGLDALHRRGQARILDKYISDAEEQLCFCASDVVLLPYIKHFGSSSILSSAAAAGKMVIASDEGLVSRRVKEHKLGWLFPSGNSEALQACLDRVLTLTDNDLEQFRKASIAYSLSCSRNAFRNAILKPFLTQTAAA